MQVFVGRGGRIARGTGLVDLGKAARKMFAGPPGAVLPHPEEGAFDLDAGLGGVRGRFRLVQQTHGLGYACRSTRRVAHGDGPEQIRLRRRLQGVRRARSSRIRAARSRRSVRFVSAPCSIRPPTRHSTTLHCFHFFSSQVGDPPQTNTRSLSGRNHRSDIPSPAPLRASFGSYAQSPAPVPDRFPSLPADRSPARRPLRGQRRLSCGAVSPKEPLPLQPITVDRKGDSGGKVFPSVSERWIYSAVLSTRPPPFPNVVLTVSNASCEVQPFCIRDR